MNRPIPLEIQSVAEHAALVKMALWEYRTPAEQAAWLVVEGLRRAGYLTEPACPPEVQEALRRRHAPEAVPEEEHHAG